MERGYFCSTSSVPGPSSGVYIPACRKAFFPVFIPAIVPCTSSGYRNFASGALTAVGTDGDYWSSSPTAAGNANAGNLGFNSGIVNPLNNNNRAFGFSVRCVQHLRGCFF